MGEWHRLGWPRHSRHLTARPGEHRLGSCAGKRPSPTGSAPRTSSRGRVAGPGRLASNALEHVRALHRRNRARAAAGIGVSGARRRPGCGPELDDPAGVHDRHLADQVPDDRQVVGDEDPRDAVGARTGRGPCPAHGAESSRPGRWSARRARCRLRPQSERHGQGDALLLTAGKLMRVAAQHGGGGVQTNLGQHLADAVVDVGQAPGCAARNSRSWVPTSSRGSARPRVLRDIGDGGAAHLRSSPGGGVSRSRPSRRTVPPAICSPRRAYPRIAWATVVFPDPDSPTRPSTSPARAPRRRHRRLTTSDQELVTLMRTTGSVLSQTVGSRLSAASGLADGHRRNCGGSLVMTSAGEAATARPPRAAAHADRHPGDSVSEGVGTNGQ